VNRRMPARGIHPKPVACLKPAVGEKSRQASPELRAGEMRSNRPDFQTHNLGSTSARRRVIDPWPGVSFRRSASRVTKVIVTE